MSRKDPSSYLPRKASVDYRRGQVIFDHDQPSDGLYQVVQGRVKVSTAVDGGAPHLIDIYSSGEFFGESGLLGLKTRGQTASAIDFATLIWWTTTEVEEHIEQQPALGMTLIEMMVERCVDFEDRLQSIAVDVTGARLARNLLRLAERHGVQQLDGALRLPPVSHKLLAEYVGTSREIITVQMSYLRDQGHLKYSRTGIDVFTVALRKYLGGHRRQT